MTTNKITIPPFTSKHLRPRREKRVPVVLTKRKTAAGRPYLEAPPVCEVRRPWVWSKF